MLGCKGGEWRGEEDRAERDEFGECRSRGKRFADGDESRDKNDETSEGHPEFSADHRNPFLKATPLEAKSSTCGGVWAGNADGTWVNEVVQGGKSRDCQESESV